MNRVLMHISLTILTIITLTGCDKDVDIADYIDSSKSIELIIRDKADSNSFLNPKRITILPGDARYSQLIKWGIENAENWKSDIASNTMADANIIQGNFYLNYYLTGYVIINYKDKEGEPNQIKKKVNPDDFQFLFK